MVLLVFRGSFWQEKRVNISSCEPTLSLKGSKATVTHYQLCQSSFSARDAPKIKNPKTPE